MYIVKTSVLSNFNLQALNKPFWTFSLRSLTGFFKYIWITVNLWNETQSQSTPLLLLYSSEPLKTGKKWKSFINEKTVLIKKYTSFLFLIKNPKVTILYNFRMEGGMDFSKCWNQKWENYWFNLLSKYYW